ncbi:MAG: hypothetical protein ACTHLE_14265 [Agriterribacter sp.]
MGMRGSVDEVVFKLEKVAFTSLKLKQVITLSVYYHKFDFVILDACFSVEKQVWFALNGSKNIEWNIDTRTISRMCGEVVQNNLAPHLKGYSCIRIIASKNLLIAANVGSFRIEFYRLDSLSKLDNIDALGAVYTKNIIVHPLSIEGSLS